MRLLATGRLSRKTDTSTSVETQLQAIRSYAEMHGHQIIEVDPDLNVSGAVPIRDRPSIGPWLAPDRLAEWDGLIGFKIDRLFRDHYDYVTFYHDVAQQHGKVIIAVGEGIDTSTQMGRMMAGLLAQFAEWELERMRDRRRDAAARLRDAARWNGGKVPYGYRPAKAEGGYILVPDEGGTADIVRELAAKVIAGRSCTSLVTELNRRNIPSAQGKRWGNGTVLRILRDPKLRGYIMHWPPRQPGQPRPAPEVTRGPDGLPVRREAVLDDKTWQALQEALDAHSSPESGARSNAALLLQVAFCAECERPLYCDSRNGHRYYRCSGRTEARAGTERCTAPAIPADELEEGVEHKLLSICGDVQRMVRVREPGEDHSAELAQVSEAISSLQADRYQRGLFKGDKGAAEYAAIMSGLEERRAHLESLPQRPAGYRLEPAGMTYAAHWAGLDAEGRRAFLLECEVRVLGARISGDVMLAWARDSIPVVKEHAVSG